MTHLPEIWKCIQTNLPTGQWVILDEIYQIIEIGWPLGMPLVKKIDTHLWEIRSNLDDRIARVIVTIYDKFIVLLHGFIKKTQKTPANDFKLAKKRMLKLRGSL